MRQPKHLIIRRSFVLAVILLLSIQALGSTAALAAACGSVSCCCHGKESRIPAEGMTMGLNPASCEPPEPIPMACCRAADPAVVQPIALSGNGSYPDENRLFRTWAPAAAAIAPLDSFASARSPLHMGDGLPPPPIPIFLANQILLH